MNDYFYQIFLVFKKFKVKVKKKLLKSVFLNFSTLMN